MEKKKNGFTITELLAVIAILAIVILVGGSSVLSVLTKTKKEAGVELRENLKEAALTYALTDVRLNKCSLAFSKEMFNENTTYINANMNKPENASCLRKITAKELKDNGYFEDSRKYCKDTDVVIVYRYTFKEGTNEYSEYKAYTSNTTCNA